MSKILPAFFVETFGAETEQDVIDAMYDMAQTLNDLFFACYECGIQVPFDALHGRGKPIITANGIINGYDAVRADYDGSPDSPRHQKLVGIGETPEDALANLQWHEVDQGVSMQI